MKKKIRNSKKNIVASVSATICFLVFFLTLGFSAFQNSFDIKNLSFLVGFKKILE